MSQPQLQLLAINQALPDARIEVVRSQRARRYSVRIRRNALITLVIPRGGSEAHALHFLEQSIPWVRNKLDKLSAAPQTPQSFTEAWFQGALHKIEVLETGANFAGHTLNCGSNPASIRQAVESFLRTQAAKNLPGRVLEFAAKFQLTVRKITLRSAQTRWGSCSASGNISLNWRLIQTPAFVQDYVIIHELVHLLQMNHSPRFWAEVETRCPDYQAARQWLKDHPIIR